MTRLNCSKYYNLQTFKSIQPAFRITTTKTELQLNTLNEVLYADRKLKNNFFNSQPYIVAG